MQKKNNTAVLTTTSAFAGKLRHSHAKNFTTVPEEQEIHEHACHIKLTFHSRPGMGFPLVPQTQKAIQNEIDTFLEKTIFCQPNESFAASVLDHFDVWLPKYCEDNHLKEEFQTINFRLCAVHVTLDETDSEEEDEFHIQGIMSFTAYNPDLIHPASLMAAT